MSQIRTAIIGGALLTALSLSGCGDENSRAVFHSESGKHPSGWAAGHSASARADLKTTCIGCHGENLDGGISQISCMSPTAVSGFRCHATSPAEIATGCVSCHGVAPGGPFGDTAPNRKFAHDKHTALTGCDSCHLNAGSGTADHAKAAADGGPRPATVTMSDAFRAKTLTTFGYDATSGTCSGVSCHGGQETPSWSTGAISLSADCDKCHDQAGDATPQYNDYFSGIKEEFNLHQVHLQSPIQTVVCTDCHNIGTLSDYQKHYSGISTNSFTSPRETVGNNGASFPTQIRTYTGTTQSCGIIDTVRCHPDTTWSQP